MLLEKKLNGANTATLVPFEKKKSKRPRKIDNSMVILFEKNEKFYKNTSQYWLKFKKYIANTL